MKLFILYIVLFIFLAGNLYCQETMMNDISYPYLEKLVEIAKTNYPKMRMYHHKVDEALIGINKAKLSWLTPITFTYLASPSSTGANVVSLVNPTYTEGYQFALYVNVGSFLTTTPTVKIAKLQYQEAIDNIDEYNLNIEAEVKSRYYTYVRQTVILNLRTKNALDMESSLKAIKYKFEKGEETFENYNKAVTAYETALQNKIEGESQVLIAKSSLEEILGVNLDEIK